MKLDLQVEQISDPVVRDSFRKIVDALRENPFVSGDWKLFEMEFTEANPKTPIRHKLGFIPSDTLILYVEGAYGFFFLNSKFDREFMYASVDGPCRVRFIAGRAGRGK